MIGFAWQMLKSSVRIGLLFCLYLPFADLGLAAPTARFSAATSSGTGASVPGVLKDSVTGLYWQKCIFPQTWNSTSSACATGTVPSGLPSTSAVDWGSATFGNGYCTTMYGSAWRLPSLLELRSLLDRSRVNPALDPSFDPGSASGGSGIPDFFWTTDQVQGTGNSGYAWTVNFYYGYVYFTSSKSNPYYLRCVSSTQPP